MSVKVSLVPPPRTRRLSTLTVGLVLFGVSLAMLVEAELGLAPWDVFHQGVAEAVGLPLGAVVIAVSVVVLLLWIPIRQRPGVGTVANAIVVGLAAEAGLAVLSTPNAVAGRAALLVGGVALNAVATSMYIGAGLGPGPRDGLMTGLARTRSIRSVRTAIEVTVLALGWLLGGTVGVGTVAFAAAIGPLIHVTLPRFTIDAAGYPTTVTTQEEPTWRAHPAC